MKLHPFLHYFFKTGFILSFFIFCHTGYSQQDFRPTVLGAAGTVSKHQSISLEWTLGETFVESKKVNEQWYTAGFHQPRLTVQPLIANGVSPKDTFRIFPNPTFGSLQLSILKYKASKLQVMMSDLAGRLLLVMPVDEGTKQVQLKLDEFPQGMYLLTISDHQGYRLKSFKVIKQ